MIITLNMIWFSRLFWFNFHWPLYVRSALTHPPPAAPADCGCCMASLIFAPSSSRTVPPAAVFSLGLTTNYCTQLPTQGKCDDSFGNLDYAKSSKDCQTKRQNLIVDNSWNGDAWYHFRKTRWQRLIIQIIMAIWSARKAILPSEIPKCQTKNRH